jgi:hypothetical protein
LTCGRKGICLYSKRFISFLRVFLWLLIITEVFVVYKYFTDNAYLSSISKSVINDSDLEDIKIIKLLKYVREEIPCKKNCEYFLLPIFKFMRPTPRQVAERGGWCADKSRLLIILLHLNGIGASKIALYDDFGTSQHALVEAEMNNGEKMVVDPVYGLYFPKSEKGYYSLDDLRKDEKILVQRIEELVDSNSDHLIPSLAEYPLDKYVYRHPRTINWNKSIFMKSAYTVLRWALGDRVNYIRRPMFVERPVLMVSYIGLLLITLTYCTYRWLLTKCKSS